MAVQTKHAAANAVIESLRGVAVGVKRLGDELADATVEIERLGDELADAKQTIDTHEEWTALLQDFRLGIRDRDELLKATIGL